MTLTKNKRPRHPERDAWWTLTRKEGSRQGQGRWVRERSHTGPRPRGDEREPAGAGTLGWGGHAGPRLRVSPAPQPNALLLAPSVQVAGRRFSLRLFLKDIYLAAPGLSCGA